jgi:hypothetical protein
LKLKIVSWLHNIYNNKVPVKSFAAYIYDKNERAYIHIGCWRNAGKTIAIATFDGYVGTTLI